MERSLPINQAPATLLAEALAVRAALHQGQGRDGVDLQRLEASVIRPLREASVGGPEADLARAGQAPTLPALAERATAAAASPAAPSAVLEAAAALQDLACRLAASDGPAAVEATLARLQELQAGLPASIRAERNGPYLVAGAEHLSDWLGQPIPTRPLLALCRCGASRSKPFCDGSHAEVGFSDAKDPQRVPDRRDVYVGQQLTIFDNRGVCQHSGFCTDRLANAFRLGKEPFVAPSGGRMDEIIRAVRDCPSGALSFAVDGVEVRATTDWHGKREAALEVTRDGPYRVTGGVPLVDDQGAPVPRGHGASLEHYALCRCGHSQNKPFCSGMHWYVGFHDPVRDPTAAPSVFEWAGGLPAFIRMTRLFYEKHVPADPLLAPLFANMSEDHPQRVAMWLAEVFGGPKHYSEEFGGYQHMVGEHVGANLSEEQRARFVALLLRSASEAGLPNDPEFRSAFQSYLEWGSRLAVENSQPGARPPQHMPMPRWDWDTSAGPPGSRVSALAPPAEEERAPVALPGDGEAVGFERHIKPLFRSRDRRSMQFAFDLWSADDVRAHAPAILDRVRAGTMPCDGAWPAAWVDVFERWVRTGMAP